MSDTIELGFQSSVVFYVLLMLLFVLAVLITLFIARKVGKSFSPKYQRWVYVLVAIIPLKELVEIQLEKGIHVGNPFFWYWAAFLSFCGAMFYHDTRTTGLRRHE